MSTRHACGRGKLNSELETWAQWKAACPLVTNAKDHFSVCAPMTRLSSSLDSASQAAKGTLQGPDPPRLCSESLLSTR